MAKFDITAPDGQTWEVEAPDDATEEQVMAFARSQWNAQPENLPEQKSLGDFQGLLRQFANSASFGFDDELAGAVSAATGGDYESARDAYNAESQRYAQENPGKSLVAGLAGGLATGIGGGGALAATRGGQAAANLYRGTTALGRLGLNVGAGALTGAITGAGNAEEGRRLEGAAAGGVIGGATGAAVQPIAWAGKKVADTVTPAFRWAKDRVTIGPEQQFMRKLIQQMERDGLSPRDVQKRLTKLGPDSMLADVGENVRGLAEDFAQKPGKAKQTAVKAMMDRSKKQASRITESLMDSLSVDDINFDAQRLAIHQSMREAGKGYAPILDSVETPMNEKIMKLMDGPPMKSALAAAHREALSDVALGRADSTAQKYFSLNDKGEGMLMPFGGGFAQEKTRPTLRVWDYVKRGLDVDIKEGTDAITGKLSPKAEKALEFKKQLLREIDAVAPQYAEVRKAFADEASLETALKLGRGFFNKDSEITRRVLDGMSEPEKAMFRAGAARAARDKVMSAPETGEAWKRIWNTPLYRERLQQVFPDSKSLAKFARSMEREATFGQTKNALIGNSRTALRQSLRDDTGVDPAVVLDVAQGRFGPVAAKLAGRGVQAAMEVPEATRNVAADYLFATDPATKAKAMQMLQAQALRMQRPPAAPPSLNIPLVSALLSGQVNQGP